MVVTSYLFAFDMIKLKEFFSDFISLFYPHCCVGCGKALVKGEEYLCLSCLFEMPYAGISEHKWNFLEERLSGRIRLQYATTYLYFEKDGITQQILHELKYRGNLELGMKFGRMFGKELMKGRFKSVDVLVPVPLHPNKLKIRGYNQSEVICRGMAEVMKIPVMNNLIERIVENSTQTKKGAEERWENVQGIFRLKNEELVKGMHLLLVDDVLTTGATLEAMAMPFKYLSEITISIAALAAVN